MPEITLAGGVIRADQPGPLAPVLGHPVPCLLVAGWHDAAGRQMHVEHVREIALEVREQGRLFRDRAEQLMLKPATDNASPSRSLATSRDAAESSMSWASAMWRAVRASAVPAPGQRCSIRGQTQCRR